jgi:hypothetical protein
LVGRGFGWGGNDGDGDLVQTWAGY